jgi:hypothetical protein
MHELARKQEREEDDADGGRALSCTYDRGSAAPIVLVCVCLESDQVSGRYAS